jgi:hypothetical protein
MLVDVVAIPVDPAKLRCPLRDIGPDPTPSVIFILLGNQTIADCHDVNPTSRDTVNRVPADTGFGRQQTADDAARQRRVIY